VASVPHPTPHPPFPFRLGRRLQATRRSRSAGDRRFLGFIEVSSSVLLPLVVCWSTRGGAVHAARVHPRCSWLFCSLDLVFVRFDFFICSVVGCEVFVLRSGARCGFWSLCSEVAVRYGRCSCPCLIFFIWSPLCLLHVLSSAQFYVCIF